MTRQTHRSIKKSNARIARVQDKLHQLRQRVKHSYLLFWQRREARLARWQRAFRTPMAGGRWVFAQAKSLWAAMLSLPGLSSSEWAASTKSRQAKRRARNVYQRRLVTEMLEPRVVLTGGVTTLLKDIGVGEGDISEITQVGSDIFFVATTAEAGKELWKVDPSATGGAVLVKDIREGRASSNPQSLIALDNTLFFTADDGIHGRELWKSDGTESGTVMVKDIRSGALGSSPAELIVMDQTLYFTAVDSVSGREIWKSDGTEEGTELIADIFPGTQSSWPSLLTLMDDEIYFFATSTFDGSVQLWRTDGTESGTTVQVTSLVPGEYDSFDPTAMAQVGGSLYIVGYSNIYDEEGNYLEERYELWVSDGTQTGTESIAELEPEAYLYYFNHNTRGTSFYEFGNQAVFTVAQDESGTAFGLWITDGTSSGTQLLTEVLPGPYSSSTNAYAPPSIAVLGDYIYFAGYGSEEALMRIDGATLDIEEIQAFEDYYYVDGPAPRDLIAIGDELYFTARDLDGGRELWKSNGTQAGTVRVVDVFPGFRSSFASSFSSIDEQLFFSAAGISGLQLWTSDGSEIGTTPITNLDFASSESSGTTLFVEAGDNVFFIEMSATEGVEYLWVTNGTTSSTVPVASFSSLIFGSDRLRHFSVLNGELFFSAVGLYDGNNNPKRALWKSNGTPEGTQLVYDDFALNSQVIDVAVSNGNLFFHLTGNTDGGLWKSDGTTAGTSKVKTIRPGGSPNISNMIDVNGTLFFVADDGVHGRELWRSDGTELGTYMVKDIRPGSAASIPSTNPVRDHFYVVNDILMFTADDGEHGTELWRSDGTEAGTYMVKDIRPGSSSGLTTFEFFSTGTELYFAANDGSSGNELWRSDGTLEGTYRVKDIRPGSGSSSSNPTGFTWMDNVLYFRADDGVHGQELWRSDGTSEGTTLVRNIRSGSQSSQPHYLTVYEDVLYFFANDGIHGFELWRSDGTEDGTLLFLDINSGIQSSGPTTVPATGALGRPLVGQGSLYFFANDGIHGFEPHVIRANRPTISFTSVNQTVGEDVGTITLTAELSEPFDFPVSVPIAVLPSSTATSGADFVLLANAFAFLPGATTGQLQITILDDINYEDTEFFVIALLETGNVALGDVPTNQITILDNDLPPLVSFVGTGQVTPEGIGLVDVEVRLTATSYQDVVVPLTFAGSATYGVDYEVIGGDALFIPAGQLSAIKQIYIVDDDLPEPTEIINIGFGTITGGAISSQPNASLQYILTIPQNDAPTVGFTSTQRRVSEDVGTVEVTLSLSQPSPLEIRVPFSVSGTATLGEDYTLNHDFPSEIVFAPYQVTQTISVTIIDDDIPEPGADETVILTLGEPTNAVNGGIGTHVISIQDNDVAFVQFTSASQTVWENVGSTNVTVQLSQALPFPVSVPITVSGTGSNVPDGYATLGSDFSMATTPIVIPAGQTSASRVISIVKDNVNELTERITIGLGDLPAALQRGNRSEHSILIRDANPVVSVTASVSSVVEANRTKRFTVRLSAPSNVPITVPFTLSGTAKRGLDYTASHTSSITIPAGSTSADVLINIIDDNLVERTEYIIITLRQPNNGAIIADYVTVRRKPTLFSSYQNVRVPAGSIISEIEIVDNDSTTISWGQTQQQTSSGVWRNLATNPTVREGSRPVRYTVRLSNPSSADVSVQISFTGNATRNSDYRVTGLDSKDRLRIPAGQASAHFFLQALNDNVANEPTERVNITMTGVFISIFTTDRVRLPNNAGRRRILYIEDTTPKPPPPPSSTPQPGSLALPNTSGWSVGSNVPGLGSSSGGFSSNNPPAPGALILGFALSGLMDDATIFFDSNFNGVIDSWQFEDEEESDGEIFVLTEPSAKTRLDGSFQIAIPEDFDLDENGVIDPSEGRWVSTGGFDTSIQLPQRLIFSAPMGYYVLTPLTTLVERLVATQDVDVETATGLALEALDIEGFDIATTNPVVGAISGDAAALKAEAVAIELATTVLQIADLFAGLPGAPSVAFLGERVFEDLAEKISLPGSVLDLSLNAVVASVIEGVSLRTGLLLDADPSLHSAIRAGAANVIAAGNALIRGVENESGSAAMTELFQVKKVMLGQAAPALRSVTESGQPIETVETSFTGMNLAALVNSATIGDIVPADLFIGNGAVVEGDSGSQIMQIPVVLAGSISAPVTVDFATVDASAVAADGDYTPISGTLTWNPGDDPTKILEVEVFGNTTFETDKHFMVVLTNPTNVALQTDIGFGFILNDDSPEFTATPTEEDSNRIALSFDVNEVWLSENDLTVFEGELALSTDFYLSGLDTQVDSLLLDFTRFGPGSHTVHFDGGVGNDNEVEVLGGEFQSVTHTITGSNAGVTRFDSDASSDIAFLHWTGIEDYRMDVGIVSNLIIELPEGVTDAILEDADDTDEVLPGRMRIRSATDEFLPLVFTNPSDKLVVRFAGLGTLSQNSLDSEFEGTVEVEEEYEPAANGQVELIDGNLSIITPAEDESVLSIGLSPDGNHYRIVSLTGLIDAGVGSVQTSPNTVLVPVANVLGSFNAIPAVGSINTKFVVDFANGIPLPVAGLDLAADSSGTLVLKNEPSESFVYLPDAVQSSQGEIFVGGRSIRFSDMSSVEFDSVPSVSLQFSAAAVISVEESQLSDGTLDALAVTGQVAGVDFSSAKLRNTRLILDLDSNATADTVSIMGGSNLHEISHFQISASAEDSVTFFDSFAAQINGTISIEAGSLAFDDSQAIEVSTTGSGQISLSSPNSITIGSNVSLLTHDGDLTISANQQVVPSVGDFAGVRIAGGSVIASGLGAVYLLGRGGSAAGSDQYGVAIQAGGEVRGHSITVEGIGGDASFGITIDAALVHSDSSEANIRLLADSLDIQNKGLVSAFNGRIFIEPLTSGTLFHLGGSDVIGGTFPTLGVSADELARLVAGRITLGSDATGVMNVSQPFSRQSATDMDLIAVHILLNAGPIDLGGGKLSLQATVGGLQPKAVGVDIVADVSFAGGTPLVLSIDGPEADSDYDRLTVTGSIDLSGAGLELIGNYSNLTGSDTFTILSASHVTGNFSGLPEGSLLPLQNKAYRIVYSPTAVQLVPAGSISIGSLSKTYDALPFAAQPSVDDGVGGFDPDSNVDRFSMIFYSGPNGTGDAIAAPTQAGSYSVLVDYQGGENYPSMVATFDFEILAAPALVTAHSQSKKVGQADPILTFSVDGLQGNDTIESEFSGSLSREAGEDPGIYEILLGTLSAGPNYDLSYVSAWLTIVENQAPSGIVLSNATVAENRPTSTLVGLFTTIDPDDDIHVYTLAFGEGDSGNEFFTIDSNQLLTNTIFDFEAQDTYSIRVRTTDVSGDAFEQVFIIVIEDVLEISGPVIVGDGTNQRSVVDRLMVSFDNPIEFDEGAFQVYQRVRTAEDTLELVPVTTNVSLLNEANGSQAVLTFSGSMTQNGTSGLVDGNYQLVINGSLIRVLGTNRQLDANSDGNEGSEYVFGAEAADRFFALLGDGNGNGVVDAQDILLSRLSLGKSLGDEGFRPEFDVNGNGIIDAQDILRIRLNLGKSRNFF